MSDNYKIHVLCDTEPVFMAAVGLAYKMANKYVRPGEVTIGVAGWSEYKGSLTLFQFIPSNPDKPIHKFPSPITIESASVVAWEWLSSQEYKTEPDHDGSNKMASSLPQHHQIRMNRSGTTKASCSGLSAESRQRGVCMENKLTDEQLTRLAAEKVMGWGTKSHSMGANPPYGVAATRDDGSRVWITCRKPGKGATWSPLTDWRSAGEIVEKMRADGFAYASVGGRNDIRVSFGKPVINHGHQCESSPRAITIAALKAVGAITEGDL